ncbi:hypothetical protein LguiB_017216 [Lonicera macranthoides]
MYFSLRIKFSPQTNAFSFSKQKAFSQLYSFKNTILCLRCSNFVANYLVKHA